MVSKDKNLKQYLLARYFLMIVKTLIVLRVPSFARIVKTIRAIRVKTRIFCECGTICLQRIINLIVKAIGID